MEVLPSHEIWHRCDFPLLCNWRRLYRIVEIGVDKGSFSSDFLSRCWNIEIYLGVDPYEPYHEMPWDRDDDRQAASGVFAPYPFAKIVPLRSADAALSLPLSESAYYSAKFDFVYIDGSHRYEDVVADIDAWWPLVSDKGILAGHDWSMPSGDHAGVQKAVREFAEKYDLTVYTTPDDPSSWYVYKSGIPGTDWRRVE